MTVWREPPVQTEDYPGLFVNDGRVTGSITAGPTRLPLWAFAGYSSWEEVEAAWPDIETVCFWNQRRHGHFLHNLLQARGDVGRLLLAIADAQRRDYARPEDDGPAWWDDDELKAPVVALLRACLERLEGGTDLGQEA